MSLPQLKDLKRLVDEEIDRLHFPSSPKGLYEPIKHVLDGGGKRLRPVLLLSFIAASGGDPLKFVNQAVALELYHNFTLLHDDVMDNAPTRHGRPTVHVKWNVPTAILSGDTMLSVANLLMLKGLCDDKASRVMKVFNETAIKVDEGQQMDMNFETAEKVSIREYDEMIMLKTGALLGCACGLGVLLATDINRPCFNVFFKNAVKLGYLLGVIFQLQDDLLDTYGDQKTFGKKIGGDIVNNKKTWLSINLLDSKYRKEALELFSDSCVLKDSEKIEKVVDLYNSLGLAKKLECTIEEKFVLISELLEQLSQYFVPGGKDLIASVINTIAGRKK